MNEKRYLILKRLFDFTVALVGLVVLLPVMLVVALIVRMTSSGPALFIQSRIGRFGKPFSCIKFRTMHRHSEGGGTVTVDGDRRVTGFGRFLRKTKLDELPQLWNIVTGRMSFVGPRPDVPGYADRLEGDDRQILDLRPGITGPATLFFRNEETLLANATDPQKYNHEVIYPEKVKVNLDYARRLSFWRDVGYILATVWPWLTRNMGIDQWLGLDYDSFEERMNREIRERTEKRGMRAES